MSGTPNEYAWLQRTTSLSQYYRTTDGEIVGSVTAEFAKTSELVGFVARDDEGEAIGYFITVEHARRAVEAATL